MTLEATSSLELKAPIATAESKGGKDSKKAEARLVVLEEPKEAPKKAGAKTPATPMTSAIPTRYGSFTASNLAVTVTPGRMTHDISLAD